MAKILSGNEVAKDIARSLEKRVTALKEKGVVPTLAAVRVGDNKDDIYYQKSAAKRFAGLGMAVEDYPFDANVTEEELINGIVNLNMDEGVHGILLLRPLPKHIDESAVCETILPEKDVDGVTGRSLAGIMMNKHLGFAPCTAGACVEILRHYGINPAGKRIAVIGRSLVVGKPLSLMLISLDATVSVCHTKTVDIKEITKQADILIAAAGRAKMVDGEYIKDGAAVIDVGINADGEGRFVGDVDFDGAAEIASAITPVPGGVGTVTSAVLAMHTVEAAERLCGRKK